MIGYTLVVHFSIINLKCSKYFLIIYVENKWGNYSIYFTCILYLLMNSIEERECRDWQLIKQFIY